MKSSRRRPLDTPLSERRAEECAASLPPSLSPKEPCGRATLLLFSPPLMFRAAFSPVFLSKSLFDFVFVLPAVLALFPRLFTSARSGERAAARYRSTMKGTAAGIWRGTFPLAASRAEACLCWPFAVVTGEKKTPLSLISEVKNMGGLIRVREISAERRPA